MPSPSPLYQLAMHHFDEHYKDKQSESFLREPEHTTWVSRHRTLRNPILAFGVFLGKQYIILAKYKDFCNLRSFCLCTLSVQDIPTEIVIFINVCFRINCLSGDSFDSFSFLRSRFC